jgi:antitoxin component YwqK of YwqJK toxin-antitoxin module
MTIKELLKHGLFTGIFLIPAIHTYAASAVAVNKTTGSYGYAYGKKTETEAKAAAIENCPGGGDIIASTAKDGHGAVLRSVYNFKVEGRSLVVKGLVAQAEPVGIRKPGTGECSDCLFMEIWYDNALSSDKEKFEGVGGRRGPEELKVDQNLMRETGYFDMTITDGRELKHGFNTEYLKDDKLVMRNKGEYYKGLRDGPLFIYNNVAGQETIVEREKYYRDGLAITFNRTFGATGAVYIYEEFKDGVRHGFTYNYTRVGKLESKGYYRENLRHGRWCMYSALTGLAVEEGSYEFGKKEGEWIRYDADGKTIKKKTTYARGLVVQ